MTMTNRQPVTEAGGFDIRHLTEDQRALSEDVASSMGFGHADGCAVWMESDPDGCSCELLQSVAGALHDAGVVEVVQERGWDTATRRGDRLVRLAFDPHPAQASQLSEARTAELVEALRRIRDLQPKALGYIEANGFVMDVLGPLPDSASELDRWKVLAFSLYTDLCQANSEAERALAATDTTAPDAEREE